MYESSSVQLGLPTALVDDLLAVRGVWFQDSDLYLDPNDPTYGRQKDYHISMLYGVPHSDLLERVQDSCRENPVPVVTLGDFGFFATPGFDVLYVAVEASERLTELRESLVAAFPEAVDPFGVWTPHVTLAYLRPGFAIRSIFQGHRPVKPVQIPAQTVEISRKDGVVEVLTPGGGLLDYR